VTHSAHGAFNAGESPQMVAAPPRLPAPLWILLTFACCFTLCSMDCLPQLRRSYLSDSRAFLPPMVNRDHLGLCVPPPCTTVTSPRVPQTITPKHAQQHYLRGALLHDTHARARQTPLRGGCARAVIPPRQARHLGLALHAASYTPWQISSHAARAPCLSRLIQEGNAGGTRRDMWRPAKVIIIPLSKANRWHCTKARMRQRPPLADRRAARGGGTYVVSSHVRRCAVKHIFIYTYKQLRRVSTGHVYALKHSRSFRTCSARLDFM